MRIILLVPNVADDMAIFHLGTCGDFVPVDEKTSVSSLGVPYSLEKASDIVGNALAPFHFFGTLR